MQFNIELADFVGFADVIFREICTVQWYQNNISEIQNNFLGELET